MGYNIEVGTADSVVTFRSSLEAPSPQIFLSFFSFFLSYLEWHTLRLQAARTATLPTALLGQAPPGYIPFQ